MRIGELSQRTGVSRRLLRYYEEQGLLTAERGANGYRHYPPATPETVRRIRSLLAAGLSTEVIRDILPCAYGDRPILDPCPELLATLREELSEMDAKIACLHRARDSLAGYLAEARPMA